MRFDSKHSKGRRPRCACVAEDGGIGFLYLTGLAIHDSSADYKVYAIRQTKPSTQARSLKAGPFPTWLQEIQSGPRLVNINSLVDSYKRASVSHEATPAILQELTCTPLDYVSI